MVRMWHQACTEFRLTNQTTMILYIVLCIVPEHVLCVCVVMNNYGVYEIDPQKYHNFIFLQVGYACGIFTFANKACNRSIWEMMGDD